MLVVGQLNYQVRNITNDKILNVHYNRIKQYHYSKDSFDNEYCNTTKRKSSIYAETGFTQSWDELVFALPVEKSKQTQEATLSEEEDNVDSFTDEVSEENSNVQSIDSSANNTIAHDEAIEQVDVDLHEVQSQLMDTHVNSEDEVKVISPYITKGGRTTKAPAKYGL